MTNSSRPIVGSDSEDEVTDGDQTSSAHRTYTRRWFVLAVMSVAIALRGYNQSCFGTINNVYAKYFNVAPWQVDWFVLTQSVIFFLISLPMTVVTKKMSYRLTLLLLTFTLALGFALTACGMLTRQGYGVIIAGQAIEGFSNIVSWSLPPATAAIWFSSDEVAIAVAVQVVARGIGEAVGCILPPNIVNIDTTVEKIETNLLFMFAGLAAIASLLLICFLFIKSRPPTPPSEAQAKVIQLRNEEESASVRASLAKFWVTIKSLFKSPTFVSVWFVFGAANPVLRTNNVLLSSMMHQRFTEENAIDMQVGIVLAIAWSTYTVGGFIAGPLISKTHRYKEIVTASVALMLATCVVIVAGVAAENLYAIYSGVILQGLFLGFANTSLFELLVEITYPVPPTFVTMLAIVSMGAFRLLYPIAGRWLLTVVGATSATCVPVATLLLSSILLLISKPEYKRQSANSTGEQEALIMTSRDSDK